MDIAMIMTEAALDDYVGSGLKMCCNVLGTWITRDDTYWIAFIYVVNDKIVLYAGDACNNLPPNWIWLPGHPTKTSSVELANPIAIESLALSVRQLTMLWSKEESRNP